jgi:hypothetical protein
VAHDYNPDEAATWPTTVELTDDGDDIDAASVNVPLEAALDMAAHLRDGDTVLSGSKQYGGTSTITGALKCSGSGKVAGDIPLSGESNNAARLLYARTLISKAATSFSADHRQSHTFVVAPDHSNALTIRLMDSDEVSGVDPAAGTRVTVTQICTPGGATPSANGVTVARGDGISTLATLPVSEEGTALLEFMDLSSHDTSGLGPKWYLVSWTPNWNPVGD